MMDLLKATNTRGCQVLAIDIGSSSVRTALFDARGRRLMESTAQLKYRVAYTADGGAELSPETMRDAALRCLRRTLRRRRETIKAVGVSCFWHSLLGTDAQGRPATPIYTWADSRCQPEAARLRAKLSERTYHARTGCMLRANYWPAKLRWLARRKIRAARWLSPGEWLLWQLGGEPRCSYSMASGTGLLDGGRGEWSDGVMECCGVRPEQLSVLADEPFRCAKIPELREALWFPAIGDGAAGNLGSGATTPGLAAINFGTSAAVRMVGRNGEGKTPFGLFRYRVDEQRVLLGGAVSNAGNLRAWCQRELRVGKEAVIRAHGLTVLPFWVSERAPTWPEHLRGVITGLTQATTAIDIQQATTDAVFYRLADIGEMLGARRYVVSGGLTKSPGELQRLADVLGGELVICSEPEASLRGAAVFALEKLGGKIPRLPEGRVLHPHRAITQACAIARQKQRELEIKLS
jgi:gluconokinase